MKKVISVFLSIVILGLTACAPPADGGEVIPGETEDNKPPVDMSDPEALVDGNSEFAFDLYQALKDTDGNIFYSPYSISLALAMTYAGARGETKTQMADTLGFTLPQQRLHSEMHNLDAELASRGEGAEGKDGEGFRLNIVNALWGQKDFEFLQEFLDTLDENYGAAPREVDFIEEPEQARITINDWVSEQTEERIEDLIPPGVINALTRLILTNAIYFNAAWMNRFAEADTSDGPFYLIDGGTVTVPMMKQTEPFRYASGNGYQAIELPYDGNELSMVVLLPEEGRFEKFQSSLDAQVLGEILSKMERKEVHLTMPKFEFESEFSLKKTLSEMGMPVAFSDRADFSGMTGIRNLKIAEVIHKAFVAVDEDGTEAAAATAVIIELTAAPMEPVEMTIDHPFIFLIRDIETESILFIGRVMNPAD